METQLEEANEVAKTSNQKFEDANRKLKVYKNFKPKLTPTLSGYNYIMEKLFLTQSLRSSKVTLSVFWSAPMSSKLKVARSKPR